jgi:hypothetical protein
MIDEIQASPTSSLDWQEFVHPVITQSFNSLFSV